MNLLVAHDGSDEADRALSYACDIADATDGSITVVHAVDPAVTDIGGSDPITTISDADGRLIVESLADAEDRGMAILEDAVEFAADRDRTVETELLYGDPVRAIPDYAESAAVDTIYVGHRGRSDRAAALVGSVAKELVERATIPVTVVR